MKLAKSRTKNSVSIDLTKQLIDPAAAGSPHSVDTIAALASAPGMGAVAIVRVSGPNCLAVLQKVCPNLARIVPRMMQLAEFVRGDQAVLDELLLCYFQAPASFTGEDSLEFYCHGSPYIVRTLLAELCSRGCRMADAGEFTRRAFLNGKLDLTAAEGIQQLVEASSDHQWQAARYLATGALATYIENLRAQVIGAMAYLEARIDFPDEGDIKDISLDPAWQKVEEISDSLGRLIDSYQGGKVASQGLRVAIIGRPNMGKSSLMNRLLQEQRAIVTDIAGTTRDYLEESCLIQGRLVRLIDTAGIRETTDAIEKIGVATAKDIGSKADLVLVVTTAECQDHDDALELQGRQVLRIINKIDEQPAAPAGSQSIAISCRTGEGLDRLKAKIAATVDQYLPTTSDDPFLSSVRQLQAIEEAQAGIQRFFAAREAGAFDEILAFELLAVSKSLRAVIGDVESDDVLDQIFSQFCVGK